MRRSPSQSWQGTETSTQASQEGGLILPADKGNVTVVMNKDDYEYVETSWMEVTMKW